MKPEPNIAPNRSELINQPKGYDMDPLEMRVVSFPPGAYIELDDPMTGARRLALVCDTGTEFVDYIDHDSQPTPLAILDVFEPIQWGDCRALANDLLLAGNVDGYKAFSDFLLALCETPAAGDSLTFNRAAKWAYDSRAYSVNDAARAGLVATAEARARQAAISRTAADWIAAGAV
jgi:hypothetical protein